MIQEVVKQWDENKHKLEDYFRTTKQEEYSGSYKSILQKVIELVVTEKDEYNKYDATKITVVDDIEQERKKQNRPSQNNMIETILVSFFGERGQKKIKNKKLK